jgi:5,10-methylene-tetrahydrofolate dehydrogenase/methenyl tetrahydrofolate cyclohydrolase
MTKNADTGCEVDHKQDDRRNYQSEKCFIVGDSDTVVKPLAMVVEFLGTSVAIAAVFCVFCHVRFANIADE